MPEDEEEEDIGNLILDSCKWIDARHELGVLKTEISALQNRESRLLNDLNAGSLKRLSQYDIPWLPKKKKKNKKNNDILSSFETAQKLQGMSLMTGISVIEGDREDSVRVLFYPYVRGRLQGSFFVELRDDKILEHDLPEQIVPLDKIVSKYSEGAKLLSTNGELFAEIFEHLRCFFSRQFQVHRLRENFLNDGIESVKANTAFTKVRFDLQIDTEEEENGGETKGTGGVNLRISISAKYDFTSERPKNIKIAAKEGTLSQEDHDCFYDQCHDLLISEPLQDAVNKAFLSSD